MSITIQKSEPDAPLISSLYKWWSEILLNVFVLGLLVVLFYDTLDIAPIGREFPWTIIGLTAAAAIVNLVRIVKDAYYGNVPTEQAEESEDVENDQSSKFEVNMKRVIFPLGWLIAFVWALWNIGFFTTIFFYGLLYAVVHLDLEGRELLYLPAILTIFTGALYFFYVVIMESIWLNWLGFLP